MNRKVLTNALFLGGALIAHPAVAQDNPTPPKVNRADPATGGRADATEDTNKGIAEIIVTAERRAATAQRTAASIAVRTGDDLQRQARTTLNQVLEDIPGISGSVFAGRVASMTSNPELSISIRGVRSNDGGQGLTQPATTAIYVDGVYGGISGSFDVDRVEVLRGPQGTLYGRSATGGVISINTRNPDLGAFSADGLAEAGSYNLRHFTATLNAPIVSDRLALRISGDHYERDGYYSREGGAVNTDSLRAKLLFKATDDLTVLLSYNYQQNKPHNGGVTIRLTPTVGEYIYDRTTPVGEGTNQFSTYSAQVDWKLGGVQLTYIGAIRDYMQNTLGYLIGPAGGTLAQTVRDPDNRTNSQELRASFGQPGSFLAQFGGIYYANTAKGYVNDITWASSGELLNGRTQDRKQELLGGYGEATLWLTNGTRLTGGLRYDSTTIDTTFTYRANNNQFCNTPLAGPPCSAAGLNDPNAGNPPDIDSFTVTPETGGHARFKGINYKVRIEQDLASDKMVYAMVSTGAIPGDIQVASSIPAFVYTYSSERLTSYEIGWKNRFFNNRLQANLSLYHYDYGGFQSVVTPNALNPTEQYYVSVPAKFTGGELETIARLSVRDLLTVNLSYVSARYSHPENVMIQLSAGQSPISFTDIVYNRTIANVIPLQANASFEHRFDFVAGSTLTARASIRYQAPYQARSISRDLYNAGGASYLRIPPAGIANLSLDWTSANGRFGLTGYVRNVTNRQVPVDVFLQSVTSTDVVGSVSDEFIEPRVFGVMARARF